jgi:endonuclease/exonuclease/phosphatase family metal-dependent hydrolase
LGVRAIRILSLNLWSDTGDIERRTETLVPQIKALGPELIGLQEVHEGSGHHQASQLAEALGCEMRFGVVDPESKAGPIGNAILSKFPIVGDDRLWLPSRRPQDPRNALRCDVETPVGRVGFITTHLSWELDAAATREDQAVVLDRWAKQRPGDLPTVLCGDFNCTPDSAVHQFLTGRASLQGESTYWRDVYQRRHPNSDGYTWSAKNPYASRSVERNRRIDFIFVAAMREGGPGAILHSRVVLDLPNSDGVYPSDHFGVFAEIATVWVDQAL